MRFKPTNLPNGYSVDRTPHINLHRCFVYASSRQYSHLRILRGKRDRCSNAYGITNLTVRIPAPTTDDAVGGKGAAVGLMTQHEATARQTRQVSPTFPNDMESTPQFKAWMVTGEIEFSEGI